MSGSLEMELASVLNKFCVENASNTPDFILAQYLEGCLKTFATAVQQRETWYGRNASPTANSPFGAGAVPMTPNAEVE